AIWDDPGVCDGATAHGLWSVISRAAPGMGAIQVVGCICRPSAAAGASLFAAAEPDLLDPLAGYVDALAAGGAAGGAWRAGGSGVATPAAAGLLRDAGGYYRTCATDAALRPLL